MKSKKFLFVLAIALAVYFISDFFFEDTMLYVLGGAIWGFFSVVFNTEIGSVGNLIAVVILAGAVLLLYKSQSTFFKYFAIIIIAILLYVVDFVLMNLVSYDPEIKGRIVLDSMFKSNAFLFFRILSKSLILSLIIYFGWKRKEVKTTG